MRDIVKAPADILIQYPRTAPLLVEPRVDLLDSIYTASARSEAVGIGFKSGFPLRCKCRFRDRLHDTVFDSWNSQWTLFAVGLRDVHPADWFGSVAFQRQVLSTECHTCLWRVVHLSVYTWRVFTLVLLGYLSDCQEFVRRGARQKLLQIAHLLPLAALSCA